jgi:hypothetical protein
MTRPPDKRPPGWTAKREADARRQGARDIEPKRPRIGFDAPKRDPRA